MENRKRSHNTPRVEDINPKVVRKASTSQEQRQDKPKQKVHVVDNPVSSINNNNNNNKIDLVQQQPCKNSLEKEVNKKKEEQVSEVSTKSPSNFLEQMKKNIDEWGFTDKKTIRCLKDNSTEWIVDELYSDLKNSSEDNPANTENCTDFKQITESFFKPMNLSINRSRGEILLISLEHSLNGKYSFSQLCGLMQLLNAIFKHPILPDTPSMLDKLLNPKNNLKFYAYCSICTDYLAHVENFIKPVMCNACHKKVNILNRSTQNVFMFINPSSSIKQLLEQHQEYYNFIVTKRKFNHTIKDIYDGNMYRTFVKNLPSNEKQSYCTVTFSTDDAPRFECSKFSVWPIYLQVNEVPPEVRFKRIILCGMWFGPNKPHISSFLEPFVKNMNELSSNGITCKINNNVLSIKVYPINCSADPISRAVLQGLTFDNEFGCNWCMHEGIPCEDNTRYCITKSPLKERTEDNMIRYVQVFVEGGSDERVYGVTHASSLINLNYFNIVKGFTVDYVSSCLIGVGKQITGYFLKTLSSTTIEELDAILLSIKVPHEIARLTRSFNGIENWTAKEWENFILFYSLPLFSKVLKKTYIKYWRLFVNSLHKLLSKNIITEALDKVDTDLYSFVCLTEEYFSTEAMTLDIHQMLHVSKCVKDWGPLWSYSTFPFESSNKSLLQAIHCAKGINKETLRFINMQKSVQIISNRIYPNASPLVTKYCQELSAHKMKKSSRISSVTYLGDKSKIENTMVNNFRLSSNSEQYNMIIKNGILFSSSKKEDLRSNDTYARLSDGTFIKIVTFVIDEVNNKEVTVCRIVNIINSLCDFIYCVGSIGKELILINTKEVEEICIFMTVQEDSYISTLPNTYHL